MITVRRRLLFNLDQYESAEIEVIVSEIPDDTSEDDISAELDRIMRPELARAELATSRDSEHTSLYTWKQIAEEGMHA